MTYELGFFDAFVELFNMNAALVIIILCIHVVFRIHKMDRRLLKARLFLNEDVLQQMWTSISIAGAAFALNTLLKLVGLHLPIRDIIFEYYFIELSQFIFMTAFIYAIFQWYMLLTASHPEEFSPGQ